MNRIADAVRRVAPDELAGLYNELNPSDPVADAEASRRPTVVRDMILDRVCGDLRPEEVADLWNALFPGGDRVWFNEEDGLMYPAAEFETAT